MHAKPANSRCKPQLPPTPSEQAAQSAPTSRTIPAFTNRMLSALAVCQKLCISRMTLWRAVKDGRFPKPNYTISKRTPLWSEREIDEFFAAPSDK